ncbi:unnamed protein product, partial [Polarella glacialis]
ALSPLLVRAITSFERHLQQGQELYREDAYLRGRLLEEDASKAAMFRELLEAVRALHSPATSPSIHCSTIKIPRYRPHVGCDGNLYEFPEVEVSVKVYQICNVDTAQLTFEVDFLCCLEWCDPNVEGKSPEELKSLDWNQYFNPHVEVDNCKDSSAWLDGMDAIPRRRSSSFQSRINGACGGKSVNEDFGVQLRKTMRFRGTLAMGPVDLRCFPFDIQALPIRLKARRCRGLALGTPAAGARCDQCGLVSLVDSSGMMLFESYLQHDAHLKGRGNYAVATAGDALLEFNINGLTGRHPDAKRVDIYEVCIFVKRPFLAHYFWDLLILNLLVMLATTAFWDTAAADLSSRMSISLTVILTLAAYTSSRPAPIEKAPYVTFHDWVEQMSMFLVTGISVQNVVAVVSCGGQNSEAPPYMTEEFERNRDGCSLGWCMSRQIDCKGLTVLLVAWALLALYSAFWLAA